MVFRKKMNANKNAKNPHSLNATLLPTHATNVIIQVTHNVFRLLTTARPPKEKVDAKPKSSLVFSE